MTIRERQEQWEREYLSPYATLSENSKGRDVDESQCDIRPVFQRDRDRIIHAKSFRRLEHKTQVFLSPVGDHYRTRLTHTLEVSQNARTIARALRMNESLVEAIALGHDLGHTPFGHAGERVLDKLVDGGFAHEDQSVRLVELLEKKGEGLNLTWETRDGIRNHAMSRMPHTLEGKIVRYSDKIAYINHDIDDAMRAGIISNEDIPAEYRRLLGNTTRERLNSFIHDVIRTSEGADDIRMSEDVEKALIGLRTFMFRNVYTNPTAKGEEKKVSNLLTGLFEFYMKHEELLPQEHIMLMTNHNQTLERVVCDYIAGMTDQFATARFEDIYIPKSWNL